MDYSEYKLPDTRTRELCSRDPARLWCCHLRCGSDLEQRPRRRASPPAKTPEASNVWPRWLCTSTQTRVALRRSAPTAFSLTVHQKCGRPFQMPKERPDICGDHQVPDVSRRGLDVRSGVLYQIVQEFVAGDPLCGRIAHFPSRFFPQNLVA